MLGFGRRNRGQLNVPAVDIPAQPAGSGMYVSVGPIPDGARPAALLEAGWAPFGHGQSPVQQIGAYAGRMLNQYPAIIQGTQRHSVREFGNSRWFYPVARPTPLGNLSQTQQNAMVPGSQRYGSRFSGLLGPINSRQVTGAVVAQQIRQSGLQAMNWAAGLNPLNNAGSG